MPSDATTTPAYRYGMLSRGACETELVSRHIPFRRESARGISAPVRLTGPVHGVLFRGTGTESSRSESPHEIIDCRLVLALADSTAILRRHEIIEVRHLSIYRLPSKSWPWHKPAPRHMGAVAIDASRFFKKDGSFLDVEKDFHGAIDSKTCGEGARPKPPSQNATELRELLCDLVSHRFFNVVLTPNYDPPHKNHFHLGVVPGKQWFLVH